jgi:hypothetical protein
VGIIRTYIRSACTPKDSKTKIVKGNTKELMDGRVIGKEFGGGPVHEVYAARKASSQYFNGMEAWASTTNPISTMCQYFRSATPFC